MTNPESAFVSPSALPPAKPHLADWLLKSAVWIILLPFALTLVLNIEVLLRIGTPEHRTGLAAMFDPAYQTFILSMLACALMMRSFPQEARYAFYRLVDQGVMLVSEKESIASFAQIYRNWRKSLARYLLGLVFVGLGLAFAYHILLGQNPARLLPGHQPADVEAFAVEFWLCTLIAGGGIIIDLFLVGCWIFELVVTAVFIDRAPKHFELQIQPAHPDQCGGFKVVGDLCLKMVYIVLIPTLFFSFWLYVSSKNVASSELTAIIPDYMRGQGQGQDQDQGFRIPAGFVLDILVVSGIAVFFWPMYTIHCRMLDERRELQQVLDKIADHIQKLDKSIRNDPRAMPTDERKNILGEIDSLKGLYLHTSNVPTWPFDRRVALQFASSQVVPIISLFGLSTLGQLVGIVTNLFQGG